LTEVAPPGNEMGRTGYFPTSSTSDAADSAKDHDMVENLPGWFTTITAREAVDQLWARKRRAERPLADLDQLERVAVAPSAGADEDALLTDSVSRALLVVLDRLSPAQRVAFVLHDMFALPFEAIGAAPRRSPRKPDGSCCAHGPQS
jgi:DNA-directed RNA polymerase specialized sigma24 family protein